MKRAKSHLRIMQCPLFKMLIAFFCEAIFYKLRTANLDEFEHDDHSKKRLFNL